MLRAGEGRDDEHRGAAVSADEGGLNAVCLGGGCGEIGGQLRCGLIQQLASGIDLDFAIGIGEQPIVSDAMKATRQHVQQEAAHELFGSQSHGLVARPAVSPVVLPAESHAAIITGEEPAVGDGDPVGVTREIGENGLGSCEGSLGIDDPLALS